MQGQRYDAGGLPLGGQFQVNSYTTYSQEDAAVAIDAGGKVLVVWRSLGSSGSDQFGTSVQGQRYDGAGIPLGGEFQVNSFTFGLQDRPAVSRDAAGNFVVVWDNGEVTIRGQRYDALGAPSGAEFRVGLAGVKAYPVVAPDAAGNFVVAWHTDMSPQSDDSSLSVQAQREVPAKADHPGSHGQ